MKPSQIKKITIAMRSLSKAIEILENLLISKDNLPKKKPGRPKSK